MDEFERWFNDLPEEDQILATEAANALHDGTRALVTEDWDRIAAMLDPDHRVDGPDPWIFWASNGLAFADGFLTFLMQEWRRSHR